MAGCALKPAAARAIAVHDVALLVGLWLVTRWAALWLLGPDPDVVHYHALAQAWLGGAAPGRDFPFEYPPFVLLLIALPALVTTTPETYSLLYQLLAAAADALLVLGLWHLQRPSDAGDLDARARRAVSVAAYLLASTTMLHLELRRIDLFAAACVVWACALAFVSPRAWPVWALISLGFSIKLTPLLVLPVLWCCRRARGREARPSVAIFVTALVAALLYLPFYLSSGESLRAMLAYHAERPLQAESLYATLLLLVDKVVPLGLTIEHHHGAWHLAGPLSYAMKLPSTVIMLAALGFSLFASCRSVLAAKDEEEARRRTVDGIVAVLLSVIIFSKVLSPQYLVWVLPFALLVERRGALSPARLIVIACVLSGIVYPLMYAAYIQERSVLVTLIALARNLALVVVWLATVSRFELRDRWLPAFRCRSWLAPLSWVMLLLWTAALNLRPHLNGDLFIHLRIGEDILQTGTLPRVEHYAAVADGRPFIAHEWLSAVIFAFVHGRGGGPALSVIVVEAAVLMMVALRLAMPRSERRNPLVVPALWVAAYLIALRIHARPHLFSLLIVCLFVYAIESWRENPRVWRLAWLLPVEALWANLHGGYLLGPVLWAIIAAATFLAALRREQRADGVRWRYRDAVHAGALASLLLLASLLNPYGTALWRFSFEMAFANAYIKAAILEWAPLWSSQFEGELFVPAAMVMLAVTWAFLIAGGRRASALDWALALTATLLAARAVRFLPEMAALSLPVIARTSGSVLRSAVTAPCFRRRVSGPFLAVPVLAVTLSHGVMIRPNVFFRLGWHMDTDVPEREAQLIRSRGLRGPIFVEYEDGAYIAWALHPAVRPVVDARIDVLGEVLWNEYSESFTSAEKLRDYLDRHGVGIVLLRRPREHLVTALERDGRWRLEYVTAERALFVRRELENEITDAPPARP